MCCTKLQETLQADSSCFANSLSASENRRKFLIQLPKNSTEKFCRIKIDGCLVAKNAIVERCDYFFYRCSTGHSYFVELKGKQIEKGFNQIESSIQHLGAKLNLKKNDIFGIIVSSRVPMRSPEVQVLKNKFKDKLGQNLEIKSLQYQLAIR